MFDVSQIGRRYFDVRLVSNGEDGEKHTVELGVEPPTVKLLRRLSTVISGLSDKDHAELEVIDELHDVVRDILSKNRTGYMVPDEMVDSLTFDQLAAIITAYFGWVGEERKAKN